jgi:hypothetical protein
MKQKEKRLLGVQQTFRYPLEVEEAIQTYLAKEQSDWYRLGRKGEKPSKDQLITRLLRTGIENTVGMKIPEKWHPKINRVWIENTKDFNIERAQKEYERRTAHD